MSKVIYRINRGPFSGFVEQHGGGPFRGWYSYTWSAGTEGGGNQAVGKRHAVEALEWACNDYFWRKGKVHVSLGLTQDKYLKTPPALARLKGKKSLTDR